MIGKTLGFCSFLRAEEAGQKKAKKMSGPALRSRGPQGQTQAAKGGCRAEQTCERRSIAAAALALPRRPRAPNY
ncbi:hypothetical protein SGRA_2282 [Saprospira grandis str. Lewin]|uniref:Uncharacterized protein n=1 Tax=Saprospira grandis (strain Lewin) TaxID=984262 RepID=H6L427_SAPGL|nr:hypothetical protein SGRA_2282 [Saprospira grandis str. Lewin]